jgi:hypothetical protein
MHAYACTKMFNLYYSTYVSQQNRLAGSRLPVLFAWLANPKLVRLLALGDIVIATQPPRHGEVT